MITCGVPLRRINAEKVLSEFIHNLKACSSGSCISCLGKFLEDKHLSWLQPLWMINKLL
ncbi:hypothetical protein BDE02_04G034900 [Populus trichocarpa]|nr:hypothetical protein BDE02_04G034900 [Populus trichocarpa]